MSPLLEREAELAALDAASDGSGTTILVAGEAGIGKTTLVRAFASTATVPVHVGSCEPVAVPAPLGPLHDIAETLGPPPGAPGPFVLSEDGALAALLATAGFDTLLVADVSTPYEYVDEPTYLRAWAAPGPCVMAVRHAGQDAFDKAILDASAPFRRSDGSYRLDNIFRFAVARAN